MYLYYIDKDGKYNLVDEGVVENGKLSVVINHFSDYVVLNEKLSEATTTTTTTTTTTATAAGANATGNTTKTSDDNNILLLICMLFVATGTFIAVARKKEKTV